jgi:hypothetical protein
MGKLQTRRHSYLWKKSRIELTERLRREGCWSEASRFKDEALRTLRSDGITTADAAGEPWQRMPEPLATFTLPQTTYWIATSPRDGGQLHW